MKYAHRKILFAAIIHAWLLSSLNAATINFDNIDATAGDVLLDSLSPYQGYSWINFSAYTSTPGFPGFNNGIVSGPNAAYTAGDALGSPIISKIISADDFDFVSASLGGGWYDGLNVTVTGLSNGAQAFTKTVTVGTTGAQLFTFDFSGINELDVYSVVTASTTDPYGCGPSGCSQITLDEMTLTPASGPPPPPPPPPPVSSAPEPTSFLLAGFGGLLLSAVRRRSVSGGRF